MKLNRAQKEAIVMALMHAAGNIAETWGERGGYNADLADIPAEEGVAYLASLMRKMPGKGWDTRLGDG